MSTLTDRYVHATTRGMHDPNREELARELRGEIDEMVAVRTANGESETDAERGALLELGDPERLAASYAGRPLYLIGPAYFLAWKRLLIVLLTWVPGILAIVVTVGGILDDRPFERALGDGVGTAFEIAIQLVFWTTLTFACVERYAKGTDAPQWSLDELPELPAAGRPPLGDTIGAVAQSAVAIGLLAWQELRGVIETSSDGRVPVIDSDLWTSWLPLIVGALVLEALIAVIAYRRGGWTLSLAAGNALALLAFAVPTVWLLVEDRLLDPRFIAEIDWLQQGDHLHNAGLAVAAVVVLATLADLIGKSRAALRNR